MITVDPYAEGVLVPEHHARLVADLDNFAKDAGIQPKWIYSPLPDTFGPEERGYVRHFRKHAAEGTPSGMIYHGPNKGGEVEQRMSALAGCLVRNFIRARVMTLGSVIDALPNREMPELTCLLIPNFFVAQQDAGTIAPWQISALYDYLSQRFVAGQQTILYASNMSLLGKEYGLAFSRLIAANYLQITI